MKTPFYVNHNSLLKEWDIQNEMNPEELTAGSSKKVWWIGTCGHRWQATVKNRVNGSGCPFCASNRFVAGVNDLMTRDPSLAAEWSERNLPLRPNMVGARSPKKVWWIDSFGHEWQARVADRAEGHGCPYCAGKLRPGVNDLATTNPELIEEWSEKNEKAPAEYSPKSRALVWWKCRKCASEWQAAINTKVKGTHCPYCRREETEKHYKDYLQKKHELYVRMKTRFFDGFIKELKGRKIPFVRDEEELIGLPLSVYLPDYLLAVEYSGVVRKSALWRRNAMVKNELCYRSRIRILWVLERDEEPFPNCRCVNLMDDSDDTINEAVQAIVGMIL